MTTRPPAAPAAIPHGEHATPIVPPPPLIVHAAPLHFSHPLPLFHGIGAALLEYAPQANPPCQLPENGRCCCTCTHLGDDLTFSDGVSHLCLAPLAEGEAAAYSNWPEHGLCKDYEEAIR